MAYMPVRLTNGNEAARLLDLLGYTPQEIALLFRVAGSLKEHPIEGRYLFGNLEDAFERIARLEQNYGSSSETFFSEAPAEYERIESAFSELGHLLELEDAVMYDESIEKLKLWLNNRRPHGLPTYRQVG